MSGTYRKKKGFFFVHSLASYLDIRKIRKNTHKMDTLLCFSWMCLRSHANYLKVSHHVFHQVTLMSKYLLSVSVAALMIDNE